MRTFAEKSKATMRGGFPKDTITDRSHSGHSRAVNSVFDPQRMIGNQAVQGLPQSNAEERNTTLTSTTSSNVDHDFIRIPVCPPPAGPIQRKLSINTPGDEFEQEADRVAEQVMRIPDPQIQRALVSDETCPELMEDSGRHIYKRVQATHAGSGDLVPSILPADVSEELAAPGHALDSGTRNFMASRFGHDFSQVRVHTGLTAARSSQALNARAYTMGNDIVFGAGQFAPGTTDGRKLLAHELTHVVQQNRDSVHPGPRAPAATLSRISSSNPLIQCDFVNDARGNPIAFQFRIGTELDPDFVILARRLIGEGLNTDGAIPDESLLRLRAHALTRRQTLNDYERMFMAGLLDPANITVFNGTVPGAPIQFPVASITRRRLDRVNNLGRVRSGYESLPPLIVPDLPQSVRDADTAVTHALHHRGEFPTEELITLEEVSREAIRQNAASFPAKAESLLSFIAENNIEARGTLSAMIQGASDNSRRDRLFAGIVYAIGQHANHVAAGWVARGEIKVDALDPGMMAALPGFTAQHQAAYVSEAQSGGVKGDTIYVNTALDIENTHHRSLIIHEFQHAQDDAAASPTGTLTSSNRAQMEARAFRSQARYIYDQLDSERDIADRTTSATQIAAGMALSEPLNVALVLEGRTDPTRYRPFYELINQQAPAAARITPEQINRAFSFTTASLETMLLTTIIRTYSLHPSQQAVTGGLSGESIMDWINRI